MATLSWVGGTGAGWVSGGTSISSPNTPSGIQNNDGLFAFVHCTANTTITPPAGWTQVAVVGTTAGSDYNKLYAFQKDTVTSGNSNTSYTFTAGVSTQLSLAYACVRPSAGSVRVDIANTQALADQYTFDADINFPDTNAVRNGSIFLMVAGTYWTVGGSYSPIVYNASGSEAGATQWTGNQNLNLMAGMRLDRGVGQGVGSLFFKWGTGSIGPNAELSMVLALSAPAIEDTLTDGVDMLSHSGEGIPVYAAAAEALATSESVGTAWLVDAAESAILADEGVYVRVTAPEAADAVNLTPDASVFPRWGGLAADTLAMTDLQVASLKFADVLAEIVDMTDVVRAAEVVALALGVTLTDAMTLVQAVTVLDALLHADTFSTSVRYTQAATEALLLQDSLRNFFAADLTDAMLVTESVTPLLTMLMPLTETVTITPTLENKLFLRVDITDGVDIEAAEVLRMIFAGTLTDTVEVTAGYIQPNGAFTTWAINTRTAATTEYTGYDFRSFARMGNRYLGASASGLYVLDGDTDDGGSILAQIKTGFAQFAGSRYTSLQAVYLGLRADGEFRLFVTEGDGTRREYKILTQSMTTAKVQTGKGIRARYLSFELVSTGQDFDLDAIEIVPLLARRRV